MKEYCSAITIAAPAATIWKLLTDGANYPAWNTTVDKLEGTIGLGQTIKVFAKISPDKAFPVKVTSLEENSKMVWTGGAPLKFIFKGERTFTLTEAAGGQVEFEMREVFDGLFSSMIVKSIPDLQPDFDAFAACLKKAAEAA